MCLLILLESVPYDWYNYEGYYHSNMDLKINKRDEKPIYEQIRSQIEKLVRGGVLSPGDKIPSVRQLANKLGVGKNTVSQAYDELSAESII